MQQRTQVLNLDNQLSKSYGLSLSSAKCHSTLSAIIISSTIEKYKVSKNRLGSIHASSKIEFSIEVRDTNLLNTYFVTYQYRVVFTVGQSPFRNCFCTFYINYLPVEDFAHFIYINIADNPCCSQSILIC